MTTGSSRPRRNRVIRVAQLAGIAVASFLIIGFVIQALATLAARIL